MKKIFNKKGNVDKIGILRVIKDFIINPRNCARFLETLYSTVSACQSPIGCADHCALRDFIGCSSA